MRIALIITLLVSFSVCVAAQPQAPQRTIPKEKAVLEFKATNGTVTFKHQEHATKYAVACQTCHHTLKPADTEVKGCSKCHTKAATPKMPSLQNAVHKKCWDCHKVEAAKGKKLPLQAQCNSCHVKKA